MGKSDGKYVQLEIGGKPHTVEVDDKGNTIKDLGRQEKSRPTSALGSEGHMVARRETRTVRT